MQNMDMKNVVIIPIDEYEKLKRNNKTLSQFMKDAEGKLKFTNTWGESIYFFSKEEFTEEIVKENKELKKHKEELDEALRKVWLMPKFQLIKLFLKYNMQHSSFIGFMRHHYNDLI